jgi:hypothetical protein
VLIVRRAARAGRCGWSVNDAYDAFMAQCPAILWVDTEGDFRCELGDACEALSLRDDAQAYRDAHPNRRQPPHWVRGAEGEEEETGGEA